MNLKQERLKLRRKDDLLCAIETLQRRHDTRLAMSDEYRMLPALQKHWARQAEMSLRGAKRLTKIYQAI